VKKAIIITCNGTTDLNLKEITLDKLFNNVKGEFLSYDILIAYTSTKVINKMKKLNVPYDSLDDILSKLSKENYQEVYVLSTFVFHGIKTKFVERTVLKYRGECKKIAISDPLLSRSDDYQKICEILSSIYMDLNIKEQLILVAHGSKTDNSHLKQLSSISKGAKHCSLFEIGALEGHPNFDEIHDRLSKGKICNVILMPFMLASSYHSNRDIFGDSNSWKTRFLEKGFSVFEYKIHLLEVDAIQNIFIEHLYESIKISSE